MCFFYRNRNHYCLWSEDFSLSQTILLLWKITIKFISVKWGIKPDRARALKQFQQVMRICLQSGPTSERKKVGNPAVKIRIPKHRPQLCTILLAAQWMPQVSNTYAVLTICGFLIIPNRLHLQNSLESRPGFKVDQNFWGP